MTEPTYVRKPTLEEMSDITEAKRKIKKYALKTAANLAIAFAAGVAIATVVGKLTEQPAED